jgi:hypothetical protein
MATYLSRTQSSSNQQIFTISTWVKRANFPANSYITNIAYDADNRFGIILQAGKLSIYSLTAGIEDIFLNTSAQFRDVSAWYHIVVAVDTTQATASDRAKLYVNGTQITSFASADYPTQNLNFPTNNTHYIGCFLSSNQNFNFYGSMSHYHYTDGYAYDASTFGETDATTGIWKPKTGPSVTYGTNGFFLKFENLADMDLDSSPNNLTFSTSGNLTQTVDTPSNNFATFNPLWRARVNNIDLPTYMSNGNTTFNSTGSDARLAYFASTLGVTSGKYYWEVKSESGSGGGLGVCYNNMQSNTNAQFWDNSDLLGCAIKCNGNVFNGKSGDGSTALGVTYSEDDIYGFALDMDNYALYAHINGTYVNSGVPTSGASRTGSLLNLLTSGLAYLNSGEPVFPFFADLAAGSHAELKVNFGNGYFGTTAVSSATSDESGLGIFEYTVPSGYYALCTKNINEQEYD